MNLHKIYGCVIAAVLIVLAFVGWQAFKAHDAWKDFQRDLAVSNERIKQNQAVEKKDNATIATATSNIAADNAKNAAIDSDTKKKLDGVTQQLSKQLTTDDVRAILQQEIPKLNIHSTKDQNGNQILAVADTQENRDILNQADGAFKTCKFTLDDCQKKQANFLDIIKQKDDTIAAQQETIKAKQATIEEKDRSLKEATSFGKGGNIWSRTGRVAFPIGCAVTAAWGASKAKADPKVVAIAGGSAGGICAFKFPF